MGGNPDPDSPTIVILSPDRSGLRMTMVGPPPLGTEGQKVVNMVDSAFRPIHPASDNIRRGRFQTCPRGRGNLAGRRSHSKAGKMVSVIDDVN